MHLSQRSSLKPTALSVVVGISFSRRHTPSTVSPLTLGKPCRRRSVTRPLMPASNWRQLRRRRRLTALYQCCWLRGLVRSHTSGNENEWRSWQLWRLSPAKLTSLTSLRRLSCLQDVYTFVLDDYDSVFVGFIIYLQWRDNNSILSCIFCAFSTFVPAFYYLLNALQNCFMHNITRTAITVFYSIIS